METLEKCPACGSHVLFVVDLDYAGTSGFRPDVYGVTPQVGDRIASCGECAGFVVLDDHDAAAAAPATPPAGATVVPIGGGGVMAPAGRGA